MTEWSSIVRRAWGVLSAPTDDALSSYPVDMFFGGRPVRLAIDRDGQRHVMVPAGSEKVAPDQRQHVLAMKQASYSFDSTPTAYLDIVCGDTDLNAEFDDVVLDVLEGIDGSSTPAGDAAATIGRWRRLFRAGLRRSLSEQQRIGLFAELALLKELLAVDGTLSAGVWTGPDRLPHDLELEAGSIEVKGLGRASSTITIHGLEQLDTHDDKTLHLVLVSVVADESGTTTHELVDHLRGTFSDGAAFVSQLAKTGWTADDPMSALTSYAIESIAVVLVDASTPRLTRSSLVSELPDGIDDVRYSISVPELMARSRTTTLAELAREVLG
jgi:hypothetical protein